MTWPAPDPQMERWRWRCPVHHVGGFGPDRASVRNASQSHEAAHGHVCVAHVWYGPLSAEPQETC